MNIKNITLIILLTTPFFSFSQKKEVVTLNIHVDGVCGMCEERIENALDVKGVKFADWDQKTHQCEIVYRSDKISEDEIHQLLNEAGHDTEKSKATPEQYSTVHACCRYRDMKDHD